METEVKENRNKNNNDLVYEVEKIVGLRYRKGKKQYLLHWVGYDSDQNTWEPVKNLCGYEDMMKENEEKRNQDDTDSESDAEEKPKPKKPAKKPKAKTPAKPRIKPSFYYVSSSEDEAGMLKDRFWKDLEDGKVDIFRTADLYSTVKAIGRSARPKSLAESDLRRSGLRSASNQASEKDQTINKEKSKGKKGKKGAGKADGKAGADRSLRSPKSSSSRVSVNLGVKVDHNLSSVGRGNKSSSDDDEEDVASTSTKSSGKAETELKSKKKKKRKKNEEKKEEEEEEEEEEEVEADRLKKTKRKSLKVVKPKKKRKDEQAEESEGEEKEDDEEEEDEDESESVKKIKGDDAAESKKKKKMKKGSDKNDDDDDDDDVEEDDDNDDKADDDRKPKKKKDAKLMKKKSVAGKDDDDAGEDGGDEQEDEEREEEGDDDDDDDDAEKSKKRKKRKADIPVSKPSKKKKLEPEDNKVEGDNEEEEGEEEEDKIEESPKKMTEKEKKLKMKALAAEFDPDMVRQHMEEAIDRVIAQSAAMWREMHGEEEEDIQASEKEEVLGDIKSRTSKVEDLESALTTPKEKAGKKNKKRKEQEYKEEEDDDEEEEEAIASSSKPRKSTDSRIDYFSSEEEDEEEDTRVKSSKKQNKVKIQAKKNKENVKNSLGTSAASWDVIEARNTEEELCTEKDLEEKGPDSLNDVKAETTGEDEEQSKKDLSISVEIGDHHADQKEESENGEPADDDNVAADKEPAETSDVAVEDTSLDHLVFNLTTVESVDPDDEVDSYAEWNIKVLTNEDLYKAVKFNDFGLVQAMMREAHQFDLEQVDPLTGLTLTMIATQNYSMEIVEMLVLNGANVNARTKDGHTALTLACDKGLHCAVSLLLCLGANIGCQLPTGETALILAVKKNYYHVVRILLDHGVNIGASAVGERHALSLARQLSHQPIVELLTAHKSRLTSELFQQVSMALEGSAKIGTLVFPIQCFRLCDGNRFRVDFRHELQPTQTSRGMLLFLGHGRSSVPDMQVRLFGTSAVTKAVLNNVALQSLNEDNFILTFCPLRDGHNQLEMFTVPLSRSTYKVHLIVAAFVVTLV